MNWRNLVILAMLSIFISGVSAATVEDSERICEVTGVIYSAPLEDNSAVATWAHPAWTASIPGATWIWTSAEVEHPDQTEVKNFTRTMNVDGAVVSGTLEIASDNTYRVFINGELFAQSTDENNYLTSTQDTIDVTSALRYGLNTVTIEVTNNAYETMDPHVNPAGVLFKLSVTRDQCIVPMTCQQALESDLLYATIEDGTAVVHNDADVPFDVFFAAYNRYSSNIEDQTLAAVQLGSVAAGASTELSVEEPACAHQLDLVCGDEGGVLARNPRYEGRMIASTIVDGEFCELQPEGEGIDLYVAPYFPQGPNYVFVCNVTGFTPTAYYWYYGDGATLLNTTQDDVYHTYGAPGEYTVACTATDGEHTVTDTLDVFIPTCEQAVEAGWLTATLDGNKTVIKNDANFSYEMSLASYEMYAALIDDQTLFGSVSGTAPANGELTLDLGNRVPACAHQIDVICGAPKTPPRYDVDEILATAFRGQDEYCTPRATGNVTLRVADYYPKGGDYVFVCEAQDFTPTKYTWYYGDGQILVDTTLSDTFHTYAPGDYTVACRATDGEHTGIGVLDIKVKPAACVPDQKVRVVSDTSMTVLETGNPVLAAWQPYDSDGNTFWTSSIDHAFTNATWVWSSERTMQPEAGEIWTFKKTFDLAGKPTSGKIFITVDNGYEIWLNTHYVGGGSVSGDWQNSDFSEASVQTYGWQTVENYDVTDKLVKGQNTLLIRAANEQYSVADGQAAGTVDLNPAGVIFELEADITDACPVEPEEPEGPVCDGVQLEITSIPEQVMVGETFPVSGTMSGGERIRVNGQDVDVLLGAWTVNLTAPIVESNFTVTASHMTECEERISDEATVFVVEPRYVASRGGGGGGCWIGYHREGDRCVKDDVPEQEVPVEEEESGDVIEQVVETVPVERASEPQASVAPPAAAVPKEEQRDWLSGNVLGAFSGASLWWLIGLLVFVGVGFIIVGVTKRK